MSGAPAATTVWRVGGGRTLVLDRPRLVGILNVTPDSFSDGGRFATPDEAAHCAVEMARAGASVIDVGGESTRPGAQRVGADEQMRRVVPVIERLRSACDVLVSIDTTIAQVADAAIGAGAHIVNDVSAGTEDEAMLPLVARHGAGVILMHRLAPPQQESYSHEYAHPPRYDDVLDEVAAFLHRRFRAAMTAGVDAGAIVIDPGLGFGKTVEQNVELSRRMRELVEMEVETPAGTRRIPVMSAVSRKSFIGVLSGVDDPERRVAGTIAMSVTHAMAGVRLFRVHDIAPHREALAVAEAAGCSSTASAGAGTVPGHLPAGACYDSESIHPRRSQQMASDNVIELTDDNFEDEVLKAEVPVLVDFWAEWCQPCRMLAPTIDELAADYKGRAKVGKLDTDSNRDVSMRYGISAIPTVILFNNGADVKKFVGLTAKDQFTSALDAAVDTAVT